MFLSIKVDSICDSYSKDGNTSEVIINTKHIIAVVKCQEEGSNMLVEKTRLFLVGGVDMMVDVSYDEFIEKLGV